MARRRVGYWALHLVAALSPSAPSPKHLAAQVACHGKTFWQGGGICACLVSQHSPQHLWQCQSGVRRMLVPLLLCRCGAGGQLGHCAIASVLWHLQCLRVLLLS